MNTILISSLAISVFHAIIPNHWLPILAISTREKWGLTRTLITTFWAALAHVISTIGIGIAVGYLGIRLDNNAGDLMNLIAPAILLLMGIWFIWQHYRHKHFHIHPGIKEGMSSTKIIGLLVIAMFFSPCLEITSLYFAAGAYGWPLLLTISMIYSILTILGMTTWILIVYNGILKTNWHRIEHNAGIISGVTLIISGILFIIF